MLSENQSLGKGHGKGCGWHNPGAPAEEGARTADGGAAGASPERPEPQQPDPDRL